MKFITLARRALSVLAIHSTLFQAAAAMDFEIRNEAEFKKLFPANATVTKLGSSGRGSARPLKTSTNTSQMPLST